MAVVMVVMPIPSSTIIGLNTKYCGRRNISYLRLRGYHISRLGGNNCAVRRLDINLRLARVNLLNIRLIGIIRVHV